MNHLLRAIVTVLTITLYLSPLQAQQKGPRFKVIGFYTAKNDQAHISYVHEANKWLAQAAAENNFQYDSTNNWNNMNTDYLAQYQVVLFLDTRPDSASQRTAFQQYMENGGAWIGFHFAGFALSPSAYPQNWDWYHNQFIGAGQYKGNTWRPTSAVLRVEDKKHPSVKGLPTTFSSAPNEWYSWQLDLRKNPDINILLSIDSTSFPLGTGPKSWEIWHSGYFPVAWTNKKYRMVYVNMGHNDIDYEGRTNKELSFTYANAFQRQLILNTLKWMGKSKRKK
ncbi:ThuA domain-containing protein [Paraflavitalea sp. CAU 1676]|uniref:ThuA domain-containing protein n=1 Tax=Paraflavitalea sp. CAU 1676 TaxID=3032598 RepID=UPI0023D9AC38|nr:ThuA domain-containing protein [Paraflavitalea sp. CAU 1676]MDF2190405.1 ThuA domain-containing protein [Paraflavitalea sp. CAU 1676]